jgi:hypothetical protein
MRCLPLVLLSAAVAGCAGNVADYIGPRTSIMGPQLIRYGLDLSQSRCVGARLAATLDPLRLRRLARSAGAVRRGYFDPDRLGARDLAYVASRERDPRVGAAFTAAAAACDVAGAPAGPAGQGVPNASGVILIGPGQLPPPDGTVPAIPTQGALAGRTVWLNLGAAGSGQSIAIDAATIEEEGATRTAWFRMTDPGAHAAGENSFRLRIDCGHRTINALSRRRRDATGAVVESRDYPDNPLPVEGGTVMEIAYLSMCT